MLNKKKEIMKFAAIFLLTIVFFRILVFFVGEKSLFITGREIHHFYLGVILVMICGILFFFSKLKKIKKYSLIFFAVGVGAIVDEFTYILFTNGTHTDYSSPISYIGVIILSILIILLLALNMKIEGIKNEKT